MQAKELMLKDAIHTAIKAERKSLVYRNISMLLGALCVLLLIKD